MSGFDDFRVTGWMPEGEFGSAKIDVRSASIVDTLRSPGVRVGDVATLLETNGVLQMSDTRDEYRDHAHAIYEARGRVLIHGLGLGCYLKAILAKPHVEHVDVVELNPDVLSLVGPRFEHDPRVALHHGDALTYRFPPGTTWDVAWHDIWPTKSTEDLEQHAVLARRYARRVGWQGCWAHEFLLRARRAERAWRS